MRISVGNIRYASLKSTVICALAHRHLGHTKLYNQLLNLIYLSLWSIYTTKYTNKNEKNSFVSMVTRL